MRKGWSSREFSYWDMELLKHKKELMKQTIHNEERRRVLQSEEYKVSLMIKIGRNQSMSETGDQILKNYMELCIAEGAVWIGSNALVTGIGKKRRQELTMAIANGKKVHIYFIYGAEKKEENEIAYRGELVDLESRKGGVISPDLGLTPKCYRHKKCSIWLKVKNLTPYTEKKVADFQFVSNHKLLKDAIMTNCCFGYITECGHEY